MSRIGNSIIQPIANVTLTITDTQVTVVGPKGQLVVPIVSGLKINQDGGQIRVVIVDAGHNKKIHALHGTLSANIQNAMTGVSTGWTKTLEIHGVGYRVALTGVNLTLSVGFSHQVTIKPKTGVVFSIVDGKIVVSGIDKYLVGQVAATIRDVKPPEPYKGKGIRYVGERVRKKAGKSAKAVGGAGGGK